MARRANQTSTAPDSLDPEAVESQAPPMVGGAEGVPEDMETRIPEPGKVSASVYKAPDPNVELKTAKQYRVLRDSRFVAHGSIGLMRVGKVIDDNQYDIAAVKAQGVPLEEIK